MTRLLILLLSLAPLAACSDEHHDDDLAHDAGVPIGDASSEDAEGFGGPLRGDVLEVAQAEGGELEVGVTTEVLYLRLSPEARKEIRAELEEEVPDEGIGGAIGRALTGFANEALASTAQIPLEDVDAMRYESGRLRFESTGVNVQIEENQQEGIPMAEADARRLIDAFERAR